MNVKKRLEHIAQRLLEPRRVGMTTSLVKAAQQVDAIVLAANIDQAKLIQNQFGIISKSIDTNLNGLSGPFVLDHYATAQLLMSAARKIEDLEKEIQEKNTKIDEALEILLK